MPGLKLCQMMNRLTGGHRCLPGASDEELWIPVSSTCSQSKDRTHLESGAVCPGHSSARPEWCCCGKCNGGSSEPSPGDTHNHICITQGHCKPGMPAQDPGMDLNPISHSPACFPLCCVNWGYVLGTPWLLAQCECMILTSFVENGAASV